MKTSMQLQMGQHLTLTPQLQQAIRLLQLSTLDLNQEIQQNLESNPMLEIIETSDNSDNNEQSHETIEDKPPDVIDASSALAEQDILKDRELPIDTTWDIMYPSSPMKSQSSEDQPNLENLHSTTIDLHEHLMWQMQLTPFSETDSAIATAIIDAINNDGFLSTSLEDIQENFTDLNNPVDLEEIEVVLHRIQGFDPIAVGARDLSECLLLQLQQLPGDTPWLAEAIRIVKNDLQPLGNREYKHIMRRHKLSEGQLEKVLTLIKSLNPRPGSVINSDKTEYITPDVIVKKINNRWHVELNPEAVPRLRINTHYSGMVKRGNIGPDNEFLKSNLQDARWFLKSLQSRHETLLRVAQKIVAYQQGFFEYGAEAMKPMVLHNIAEVLEMHESTVSRVTTQKYMHTPRGVFELKYFFSSHLGTESGGETSSTAVRALIKKLVAAENAKRPLSDNKIAQLLNQQGIHIARRTIAKYREAMGIPPSHERKSLS